jgi:hypothetical protein
MVKEAKVITGQMSQEVSKHGFNISAPLHKAEIQIDQDSRKRLIEYNFGSSHKNCYKFYLEDTAVYCVFKEI